MGKRITCKHCGCPEVGDRHYDYFDESWHFKTCPIVKLAAPKSASYSRGWRILKKRQYLVDQYLIELRMHLSSIKHYMGEAQKVIKEITNACLDEVYLCIYDCPFGRLEAA